MTDGESVRANMREKVLDISMADRTLFIEEIKRL